MPPGSSVWPSGQTRFAYCSRVPDPGTPAPAPLAGLARDPEPEAASGPPCRGTIRIRSMSSRRSSSRTTVPPGCRMSSTRCWSRPAPCSASSRSTPAAATAAARCWPPSSARASCSAWSGRPGTARPWPGRCSTGRQTPASRSAPGAAADEQVEWVWLLHDDCEPAADALEQLLRGAAETPKAAVLGPKVMDWSDRDVMLEAGLTIDTVGRRVTGIEPREVDQGQHDGDRDTLAVSSAGMLVRRDVWDQLRGFDPGMALFREDMDFCWRVHAAGFRVRVITDAVVFHAQAITRRRRAVSVGRRAQLLDRRNALLTLAGNLPLRPMLAVDGRQRDRVDPARAVLPGRQARDGGAGRDRRGRLGARPPAAPAAGARRCAPGAGRRPTGGCGPTSRRAGRCGGSRSSSRPCRARRSRTRAARTTPPRTRTPTTSCSPTPASPSAS